VGVGVGVAEAIDECAAHPVRTLRRIQPTTAPHCEIVEHHIQGRDGYRRPYGIVTSSEELS